LRLQVGGGRSGADSAKIDDGWSEENNRFCFSFSARDFDVGNLAVSDISGRVGRGDCGRLGKMRIQNCFGLYGVEWDFLFGGMIFFFVDNFWLS